MNDIKKYKTDVTLDEDYGRVGIVGKAEVKIVDITTDESIQPIERKPLTINIYTLSQSEGIDILLIILAFPLAIISIILCILAVILIFAKKRAGAYLGIAAFIIMILVVIFYFRGMETLLNQISIVEEYFSWSYGIMVTGVGAGFMAAGSVIAFIVRPPKVPKGAKAGKKSDEIQFVITEDQDDEKEIKEVKKSNKGPKPRKQKKSKVSKSPRVKTS